MVFDRRKAPGLKREWEGADQMRRPNLNRPRDCMRRAAFQIATDRGSGWEGGKQLRPASQETGPAKKR